MAGIIMTCSSLRRHVDAAQKKENTAYEVYELDSRLHAEPKESGLLSLKRWRICPSKWTRCFCPWVFAAVPCPRDRCR